MKQRAKIIVIKSGDTVKQTEAKLNALMVRGWELIAVTTLNNKVVAFMRKKV